MKRRRAWAGCCALLLMLVSGSSLAQSIRCGSYLITEDDTAEAVRAACGVPDWVDVWGTDRAVRPGPPMSEWTYNDGPQQLLLSIRFDGDRVAGFDTDGYGFVDHGLPDSGDCEPVAIRPGMSKYRLLHACGPPLAHVGNYVISTRIDVPGYAFDPGGHGRWVYRERWLYDFGRNRLRRQILLENARVVDIELGARGTRR